MNKGLSMPKMDLSGMPLRATIFSFVSMFAAIATSSVVASEQVNEQVAIRDCGHCPELIILPPGYVEKNAAETDDVHGESAVSPNRVAMPAFAVGRYEVTLDEWNWCVDVGACTPLPKNRYDTTGQHPATNMTWFQANEYVQWLSETTGKNYRLPTGAEWEFAARAGRRTEHSWGDGPVEAACAHANYDDISYKSRLSDKAFAKHYANCDDGFIYTAPVGSLKPNDFGLYDTSGNVWEWTQDCWIYKNASKIDPGGGSENQECEKAAIRGGSFRIGLPALSPARLAGRFRDFGNIDIGFRIARDP
ncbi:MAG: formylglycine-generating enzyme family protein [Hyphomicrobiales bacterium]|nr:formylglycine-generating enzyme family protein [Hyphomicrobiales bacterium]